MTTPDWKNQCACFLIVLGLLLTSCSAAIPLPVTETAQPTAPLLSIKPSVTPSPTSQTCTVATGIPRGYLNLRTGPGTSFAVLRVLDEGEALTVLTRGDWLEVTDSQGISGWVNSRFCR